MSFVLSEQALLHFIYTDNLIEDEELSDASSLCMSSLSDGLAAKLLAASDKYGLPRLRLMCESVLCKIMSVNSVAIILALADRYRAMDLKSVCLKFAAENLVGMSSLFNFLFSWFFLNVRGLDQDKSCVSFWYTVHCYEKQVGSATAGIPV